MNHFRAGVLCSGLAIVLLHVPAVAAQQLKHAAPPAPVPTPILSAKTAFIVNGGGEDLSVFSGGPNRAYDQFYAGMKNWGGYGLVDTPANADLLLEIRFTLPPFVRPVWKGDSTGIQTHDPQLRVEIRDGKSHVLLWGITEHVPWALLQSNRDKNFDETMAKVLSDVQKLVAVPPAAGGPAK